MLSIAVSLMAVEHELVKIVPIETPSFVGTIGDYGIPLPGEHDLINDDGEREYMWSGPSGFATTFDITWDCYLLEMSAYLYTYSETADIYLDCFGWDSTDSQPAEDDSYFGGRVEFLGSGPYDDEWAVFDVSDEGVTFANGDRITLFCEGGYYPIYAPEDGNSGAPDDSGWMWFGGSTWVDYSDYGYGSMMIRGLVNDDMDPPYVDGQDPADGSDIEPDLDEIVFHAKDDDIGVDTGTIDFTVTDESKKNSQSNDLDDIENTGVVPGDLNINDSDPNDIICTFDVDDGYDFTIGQTITCTVASGLADQLGNTMDSDVEWEYTVVPFESIQTTSLGNIKTMFE